MNYVLYLIILVIFFNTSRFAWSIWKEKNKLGAIVVIILAITIVVLPFFTVF